MENQLVAIYDIAGNEQISALINKIKDDLSLMNVRLDGCLCCNTLQEYLDHRRLTMDVIDTIISDFDKLVQLRPV